jgi:hypothetical protein
VYLIFGLEIFSSSSLELKQVQVVYLDVQQQSGNPEGLNHHSKTEHCPLMYVICCLQILKGS